MTRTPGYPSRGAGARRSSAVWPLPWRSPSSWRRLPPNARRPRVRRREAGVLAESAPPPPIPAPIPDYQLSIPGLNHVKLATAAAGLVGTLVVFGVAWGMARVLTHSKGNEATPRCGLKGSSVTAQGRSAAPARCAAQADRGPGLRRHRGRHADRRLDGTGRQGLVLAFVIGLAGIPPRELARRWLGFFVLVGFLAFVVAPAHPARARYGLGVVASTILIKNSLALLTMLVLAGVTPFHKLLAGLRKLGVPLVLVATLQFMERYRHVLLDELDRMATARRARTFTRGGAVPWSLLTGLIGMLFLRTFERAERVHGAMVARGWQGTLHTSMIETAYTTTREAS